MNVILLGLPGSGKGTQAEKIAEKFKLFSMQSGDLSRAWAKEDARIRKIVQSGKLIPEKEMTEYVFKYLEENVPNGKNILFEGWPRFITQFQDLEKWLFERGEKVDVILFLRIDEDVVVKRLSSRRICAECGEVYNLITNPPPKDSKCGCGGNLTIRKDDNPKSIRIRFRFYRENTGELVNYLRKKGRLVEIDADRAIDVIFKDIMEKLQKYVKP